MKTLALAALNAAVAVLLENEGELSGGELSGVTLTITTVVDGEGDAPDEFEQISVSAGVEYEAWGDFEPEAGEGESGDAGTQTGDEG